MRWLKRIALAVVALVLIGGIWLRVRFHAQADVGAGYMAKLICSCVFVGGRAPEACRSDLPPEMSPVRFAMRQGEPPGVLAWVPPLLASRSASFHPGSGCTLD